MVPAVAAPAGATITNAPAATIAATPIAPNDRLIKLLPPGPPKSPVGRAEISLRPPRNPLFQHALCAILQVRGTAAMILSTGRVRAPAPSRRQRTLGRG